MTDKDSDSTAKRYMKKIVELGLVGYSGEKKERRYFLINNCNKRNYGINFR